MNEDVASHYTQGKRPTSMVLENDMALGESYICFAEWEQSLK